MEILSQAYPSLVLQNDLLKDKNIYVKYVFNFLYICYSDEAKDAVSELNIVERLLQIIGEFDSTSKQ